MTEESKSIKIVTADPSSLGLFGLAIITLVASSQKLGITSGISLALPWAIFLGATAQLIAFINEFKNDNTFGATSFGVNTVFWYSIGMVWLIENGVFGEKLATSIDTKQLGFAYLAYLIYVLYMTVVSTTIHKVSFLMFCLSDILFLGLVLNAFGIMSNITYPLAGCCEFMLSICAFYSSAASIINNHFGKVFLPLGQPFVVLKNKKTMKC